MQPVFHAVTPAIADRLTAIVGAEQISAAQADLDQHAHDQGFYPAHAAEIVVWPTSAAQVSQVLALASAQHIPVTAWGAGTSIEANPQAALLFHWRPLGRQVRIEGRVEHVSSEESDEYFATRQRDAQLGAVVSRQSEPLGSREELYERIEGLDQELDGGSVPRPPTWGGFRLVPAAWEFWQHRANRLHDRFRYKREPSRAWTVERLYP